MLSCPWTRKWRCRLTSQDQAYRKVFSGALVQWLGSCAASTSLAATSIQPWLFLSPLSVDFLGRKWHPIVCLSYLVLSQVQQLYTTYILKVSPQSIIILYKNFNFYSSAISKQHSFSPIDVNLHLRTIGHNFSTGGIFATFPEAHITTLFGALRDGIIATAILMFGVQAVCDKNNLNVSRQTQPIYLAFLVAVMSQGFCKYY